MTSTTLADVRVLFAGESWTSTSVHAKGWAEYTSAQYEEGAGQLLDALRKCGADVTYLPNHAAIEQFPRKADELETFDVVILSDIPSDTLLLDRQVFVDGLPGTDRLELLRRFIANGGGLLMIGGYMSFAGIGGKARYNMTALADALPVSVLPYDDRVEKPQGIRPRIERADHTILQGIAEPLPRLLGYNRVGKKDGAEVLMSFGDDPCLAVRSYGEGRAGAFTSDCSPHWGSREFLDWPHYGLLWANLVAWLARHYQSKGETPSD